MFSKLRFCMVNSNGTKAAVMLRARDGLVEYEVGFPEKEDRRPKRGHLGQRSSRSLLGKLKKSGCLTILRSFVEFGLDTKGDVWSLQVDYEDGFELDLSGSEGVSAVSVIIQDLAEILESQFAGTAYISPSRLDRIDICLVHDDLTDALRDHLTDYDECFHTEILCLDRYADSIVLFRKYPSMCTRTLLSCRCGEEVRAILDQTAQIFSSEELFEDLEEDNEVPPVVFRFSYHDGSTREVFRNLSLTGLRDLQYVHLLDVAFETMLQLSFKEGLFDKRFLFPRGMMEKTPFFVAFSEEEMEEAE